MAKQVSTACANFVEGRGSWREFLQNGLLMFYSSTQPTSADAACTGTACVRFSKSAGAVTKEVRATTVINFTSTTGNCTALTVGGLDILGGTVTYSSPSAIATAVAAAINAKRSVIVYAAVASSNSVTITAPKNSGVALNGLTVAVTVAAGTASINGGSSTTLGGTGATAGVAAVNCLELVYPPVAGVCLKETTAWLGISGSGTGAGYIGFTNSFTTGTTQTAGWFRWYASMDGPELTGTPTADTLLQYMRLDGTIGVDLTATGGTTFAFGATQTQNSFTHYTPANQG